MSREDRTYTSNLVAFAGALRDRGVAVSTADVVSAARALGTVDPLERDQFYYGLKATVVDEPTQEAVFDELFEEYWDDLSADPFDDEAPTDAGAVDVDERVATAGEADGDDEDRVGVEPPESPDADGDGSTAGGDPSDLAERRSDDRQGQRPDPDADEVALEIGQQERSTSPTVGFEGDRLGTAELELLVTELGQQLGTLRGFRRRVQPSGTVDLRRSLDVVREGNPNDLPRVDKERSQAKVRFFVDVSHSMLRNMHQEFLLLFLFDCMRQFADVRVFLFDTDTAEVTRHFQAADVGATLREMQQAQTEWGAGTKIGACLADVLATDPFVIDRDTVTVVVSDGWDAGDHELLREQMQELDRRSRTVLWFNPRASAANYEPSVGGMRTALPYVSHLFGFGTVDDLRDIVDDLRSRADQGR